LYVQRGYAHLGIKNYELAEANYEAALTLGGANGAALWGLWLVNFERQRFNYCVKISEKMAAGTGSSPEPYVRMAMSYNALAMHKEALAASNKALTISAKDGKAIVQRGVAHDGLGHFGEARDDFDAASKDDSCANAVHLAKASLLIN